MPRACTICAHPEREAIEKGLVAGTPYRSIAQQFNASPDAVIRHKRDHLPQVLAAANPARRSKRSTIPQHAPALAAHVAAAAVADERRGINVLAELETCFARVNKLFAACDAWLTDAEHPDAYDIGPRSTEVRVTYFEEIAPDVVVRRKASLAGQLQQARICHLHPVLLRTPPSPPPG